MIGRGCSDNVALGSNLSSESLDWTGNLVDFAEDNYTREFCSRIVWNCGVEDEDAYRRRMIISLHGQGHKVILFLQWE